MGFRIPVSGFQFRVPDSTCLTPILERENPFSKVDRGFRFRRNDFRENDFRETGKLGFQSRVGTIL